MEMAVVVVMWLTVVTLLELARQSCQSAAVMLC